MEYQKLFSKIPEAVAKIENRGEVATYIPELGTVSPNKFGIHLTTTDNQNFQYGDSEEKFSIQSIAKVFSLVMAFNMEKEALWTRIGVEPSGSAFNSLVQLEYEKGIPRNPFINAGALVVCDVLISRLDNPKSDFLSFAKKVSGNPDINFSPKIAESERMAGFNNAALVNLMKHFGNIENDIDEVLDFYFNLCSIEMSCRELAQAFLFLANYGDHPITGEKVLDVSKSKRINAIMQLCGFYDEAGEFSFRVGLPGKSGVGGGIIAVHPGKFCVAVWSPRLNRKGNSFKAMSILEFLTSHTQSSIF